MTGEKLVCLFILLFTVFKGNNFLKSNLTEEAKANFNETLLKGGDPLTGRLISAIIENSPKVLPSEQTIHSNGVNEEITSGFVSGTELLKIFHGADKKTNATDESTVNGTIIPAYVNTSSETTTTTGVEETWNDTAKMNYTLVAEAAQALNLDASAFRLPKSAAIIAGVFLVSAVFGYFSCVAYRRFLHRKYGNSQVLIAEEVYDTTDLRYFEI